MDRQIVNRRYRLERKIGEGGAAEVFLGFDIVLNRRVAFKTLRLQHGANRAFRLRFEREAQNAARLTHPNIIAIFDVGEDHGRPYIVMEYIEGQTLREIIDEEGPFHPDDVAVLVEQVASGLDYAHRQGLVHRDIKPQNILVDRHGLAKVVDFGIAKGLSDSTLTEAGSSLGTVHYIAPEQASGLVATPESDIYALGVIAYEMLTGQLPFEADSAVGIAMRHLNDPPPDPSEINPDVPPEASDTVLRALEKNPSRRFPTAGEFARSLGEWRFHEASPRLAAKYLPAPTRAADAPRPDLLTTVPNLKAIEEPTGGLPGAPARDAQAPPLIEPIGRGRGGRGSVAAVVTVAAVAAMLWFGFDVSDRLITGDNDPTANVTPTSEARAGLVVGPIATQTPTVAPAPTRTPAAVTVPNVIGASRQDAERALSDLGLSVRLGVWVPSDSIPEGAVAEQAPVGGETLTEGDVVTISLSSGAAAVDLAAMQVETMAVEDVIDELTSAGLNVALVDEGNPTIAEGSVIRLEPPDRARPGDEVRVFISAGDRVFIPSRLQGQPLAEVRRALQDLDLAIADEIAVPIATLRSAGIDDPEASGIQDGDVVGIQDNGAQFGEWVDRGVSVTLIFFDADLARPTIGPSS